MKNNEQMFLDFRKTFPAYSEGVYMNHAAVSPFSQAVRDKLEWYWGKRSHFPVDVYPDLMEIVTDMREKCRELVNGESAHQISFISNTSNGLNIIANGLDWEEGDRIILNTMEFPANIYPFMNLERRGVVIDWVIPVNGAVPVEAVEAKITPRTKMLALSFVQFINGFTADMERIGELCKAHDIWYVVDGIQGVGVVPIDVQKCRIDALVQGGQKWLMWPMGTGFLYASNQMLDALYPAFAGWLSVKDSWNLFDYRLNFLETASKFEGGTLNFMGIVVAHEVLSKFLELGIDSIYQRVIKLTDGLIAGFTEMGFELITPLDPKSRSGIVSLKVDQPQQLFDQLVSQNIMGAIREGIIRFAPHCTNTMDDVERVLDFLKKTQAQR